MIDADDIFTFLPEIVHGPGYAIVWLFATRRDGQSKDVNQLAAWLVGILFWIVVIGVVVLVLT